MSLDDMGCDSSRQKQAHASTSSFNIQQQATESDGSSPVRRGKELIGGQVPIE
jgi:hypothetical protein